MKEKDIQRETSQIVKDVLEKANLKQGSIFVLGLSSSEVIGGQIGKESSQENWGNHCEEHPRYPRGTRNSSSRSRL